MIAVVITAYNEEHTIEECIRRARLLSKNIILLDTGSTDKTKTLAENLGITTFSFPYSQYVEPSRNFAIEKADAEWVFVLDADERISQKLADEILQKIETNEATHYLVPRKNIVFGRRWLKYGGWYPDKIIRLIRKKDFVNWPAAIHSTPHIKGKTGELTNHLEHYFQPSLEYIVDKTAVYEDVESDLLFKAGRHVSTLLLFRKFFGELLRRLVFKRGFFDGTYGIIESFYQAFSKTVTYIFLYEKYGNEKSPSL